MQPTKPPTPLPTAAHHGLALCRACHALQRCPTGQCVQCYRCGAKVSQRIPHSLQKTWFFIATAVLLLIPANLLPIMIVSQWGRSESDTILSGIIKLVHEGYPIIAVIVFIASIVVPVSKLLTLSCLLLSVQQRWAMSAHTRMRLFRILEFIGRWSMMDIFVVSVMVALVRLGQVVAILPGMGALLFGGSVVITLLASLSFDPRLIWDAAAPEQG